MVTGWLALLAAQLATAGTADLPSSVARPWPVAMQQALAKLSHVEWRMRKTLAGVCPRTSTSAGLAIDYIGAYDASDRPFVRATTGMGEKPMLIAVATDGPAAAAGLRAGDELLAIDGLSMQDIARQSEDVALLADEIQEKLAAHPAGSRVTFSISREGRVMDIPVKLEPVCSARLILEADDSIDAYSDGEDIAITTGLVRFAGNDDELALVAGHELAHVIYDGKAPAALFGRRAAEDRADMAGARFAACAGYDVSRGIAFWEKFARKDRLGWLRSPSHRSSGERERRLRSALPGLGCDAPESQQG